jgi:hypothetical protein
MSSNPTAFAKVTRFVSIAVLSCAVMTGGMWAYNNRDEIVNYVRGTPNDGRAGSGTWFTRWAGADTTRLKDHGTDFFGEQKAVLPTTIEMDPNWIKNLHQPVEFNWDR